MPPPQEKIRPSSFGVYFPPWSLNPFIRPYCFFWGGWLLGGGTLRLPWHQPSANFQMEDNLGPRFGSKAIFRCKLQCWEGNPESFTSDLKATREMQRERESFLILSCFLNRTQLKRRQGWPHSCYQRWLTSSDVHSSSFPPYITTYSKMNPKWKNLWFHSRFIEDNIPSELQAADGAGGLLSTTDAFAGEVFIRPRPCHMTVGRV